MAELKINDKLDELMQLTIELYRKVNEFTDNEGKKMFEDSPYDKNLNQVSEEAATMINMLGDCIGYNIATQAFNAATLDISTKADCTLLKTHSK